tara:strand:+ start:56 stop:712 length:657 start_codon:yes stop_codon:yes gene_type:complete
MNISQSDSSKAEKQIYRDDESRQKDASERERDAELVKRCQSGDYAAFDELINLYRGKVYAMIYNMIRNDADAWDLSQDVFIKAWKALPNFEGRSAFFTWLYRIAHNVTYDWTRKKKISSSGEFEDYMIDQADPGGIANPKATDSPDASLQREEVRNRITRAIDSLSIDHKEVILLKEVEGMSYQEIADSIGCSTGTVMSRLFYARKKLKEILGDIQND